MTRHRDSSDTEEILAFVRLLTSAPTGQRLGGRSRSIDIGLGLFLADEPFRLGHLEIFFGICSNPDARGRRRSSP